ncbi:MAG: hypothetical protein WCR55_07920 [Lentisphaerota bacterium]
MNFKPIDEMSLRQLFSTAFAQEILKFSYIGPVLNESGSIETSPDAMVLDMSESPFRPLRCEFKFSPNGKDDFSHNGRFDIAIVWSLQPGCTRDRLKSDLLKENECFKLIVLSDFKAFRDLPPYSMDALSRLGDTNKIREKALNAEYPSVCALYLAAKIYPAKFQMPKMVEYLAKRFPDVKKMLPQGRSNIVSCFIQSKPPLLTKMHTCFYRWSSEFDSVTAVAELSELIVSNFGEKIPPDEDLNEIQ